MIETSFMNLYKEYYIIYFDILGYKAFFKQCDSLKKVEGYYKNITNGIENIIDNIEKQNSYFRLAPCRFRYRIFSDNICIFIESDNNKYDLLKFMQILNITSRIQRFFMFELGLLIRGSISKGKIIDNGNCIFGQGLIRAVTLESKAKYPRIYIPNANVVGQLYDVSMKLAFNCQNRADIITYKLFIEIYNCLIAEDEQIFYLDYLRDFDIKQFLDEDIKNEMIEFAEATGNGMAEILKKTKDMSVVPYNKDTMQLHFKSVVNMLSKYDHYRYDGKDNDTRKIVEKLVWVLKYHNITCEKAGLSQFHIKYHAIKAKDKRIEKFVLKTKMEK